MNDNDGIKSDAKFIVKRLNFSSQQAWFLAEFGDTIVKASTKISEERRYASLSMNGSLCLRCVTEVPEVKLSKWDNAWDCPHASFNIVS